MRLENRREKVIPFHRFIIRLSRYAMFALLMISVSLLIGILGYHYIAGIGWLDSLYMSSMILTGMGPTQGMPSTTAVLFSSAYALYSGIAFLTISAVFFTPIFHRILHKLHVEQSDTDK